MRSRVAWGGAIASLGLALVVTLPTVLAEGTETLGPPFIPIASGSGMVVAGTGLSLGQPATIDFDVPNGTSVEQVLLYWEGQMLADVVGDDTITVNGNSVTGDLIGGQAFFFNNAYSSAFRADITELDLVSPGANSLSIEDVDFTRVANGAGVLVIFDEGIGTADIDLRDGVDLAYYNFPEPRKSTIPQTFDFAPADTVRGATVNLFFSSVAGEASNRGGIRPTVIEITTGGEKTKIINVLDSVDGEEWDTVRIPVDIPAGADDLTVEAISPDDVGDDPRPASLAWLAAGLEIPPAAGCRVTGGGNDSAGEGEDGLWDGTMAEVTLRGRDAKHLNQYRFGGQAGANTGQQPQPKGEWTHHQQKGPAGRFTFHGGTSSASEGTEIDRIVCSDPGYCNPAREAPAKQIDFEGIGEFQNMKKGASAIEGVIPQVTLHWFEVHIEDLGEPGRSGNDALDPEICPPLGNDGLSGDLAECDCPDFYRITIYAGVIPEFNEQGEVTNINKTDVIYSVGGYINGGNLQIHPPTGFDRN